MRDDGNQWTKMLTKKMNKVLATCSMNSMHSFACTTTRTWSGAISRAAHPHVPLRWGLRLEFRSSVRLECFAWKAEPPTHSVQIRTFIFYDKTAIASATICKVRWTEHSIFPDLHPINTTLNHILSSLIYS